MLLSLLIRFISRLFLNSILGDPDAIEQDSKPWPTWLVVTLMLLVIGACVGVYFFFASTKT
jgi:hypothetical protein